jgi:predicted  nucleic acid-binding Zn-ribbon protein
MPTINHKCAECDSEFQLKYDINNCEDDPHFCPFCSSYILEDEGQDIDEDD